MAEMRRTSWLLALGVGAAVLTPLALPAGAACLAPTGGRLAFGPPVYVDKARAGGEPAVIAVPDGGLLVTAHAGTTHLNKEPTSVGGAGDFAVGYTNQTLNWRSSDNGKTWQHIGLAGTPNGPHSPTSSGFSDPDLSVDAGGRVYNTEINLVNVSVYSSGDGGRTWPVANPAVTTGDRPWVTGARENEVYLYVNTARQLWRSTDGGLVFSLIGTNMPVTGKLLVDPLQRSGGLIGPGLNSGIALSKDEGKTWKQFPVELGPSTQFFTAGATAADSKGTIYRVAAGGYKGGGDRKDDGEVTIASFDRRTQKWSPVTTISRPKGDAMWPWIVAGDAGRVGVVWLERRGSTFRVMAATSINAAGSTERCGGTTRRVAPRWQIAEASGRPVHVGDICLDGTACNADVTPTGERRLGEYITVAVDKAGKLIVASSDTMLKNPIGGPKTVSNPLFMHQSKGPSLFVK
ncbi:MAG TPA: sialidase family protein [Mycobacteriales bacterium]|nr:sialidase family protein [Mycobacteriales bacterium]